MKNLSVALMSAMVFVAGVGTAVAQDASSTAMSADQMKLPAACTMGASSPPSAMGGMGSASNDVKMDPAHKAIMAGMAPMNDAMMIGSQAKNIDVAFVCSMLPHHMGAVSMAKAELKYGKDAWTKKLARGIIAAQDKEIAEMTDWLAKQPK